LRKRAIVGESNFFSDAYPTEFKRNVMDQKISNDASFAGARLDDSYGSLPSSQIDALAASLNAAHVQEAAERLVGSVKRTPIVRCEALDELAEAEIWLKAENLQHGGAFKARGAMHMIGRLRPQDRDNGVITYSSGNHGTAVAFAARKFGVDAVVVMPTDAPMIKIRAVRSLGARVEFAGTTSAHRRERALEILAEKGGVMVPPFDHPDVILGQGTAALELLEQVATASQLSPALDAIYVPVGGGGLVAGTCLAMRGRNVAVIGVEPKGCESLGAARLAGKRVSISPSESIADGLRPVQVGALNYAIADMDIYDCLALSDDAIAAATINLLLHAKLLAEPSGATALAGALMHARTLQKGFGQRRPRVGVIISGGNFDPSRLADLLSTHASA
jgi:threonine dehydratase